ncbi:hypothetical protein F915_02524, partial [Acinetobacter baumannii NIPH 70]
MQNNLANQSANYNTPEFIPGDVVVLTKECRTFKS